MIPIPNNHLLWLEELGYGYLPTDTEISYDDQYFEHYVNLEPTERGKYICDLRVSLVNRYVGPEALVVDVGIGSGAFIKARPRTLGFDIMPKAVQLLHRKGLFVNPWSTSVPSVTFWDSLEHIRDPRALLCNVQDYVFVSIPVFTGPAHALTSKHYKPGEHYWYFTPDGLVSWMGSQGFGQVESNLMETTAGREDIQSFVFRRVSPNRADF